MIESKDLLIELGTEELPPTALANLSRHFAAEIIAQLEKLQLSYADIESFATPRRLAVLIKQLACKQQDQTQTRKGPAVAAAFDDQGNPTKAAQGFAKSCQTTVDQLSREKKDKGEWLSFTLTNPGKNTADLLETIIQTSLDKLPIPKRMHWGDLDAMFVRPVHWLIVLFGEQVVDCNILSLKSSDQTFGHRFHHPDALQIKNPLDYENILSEQAYVIASFAKRKELIRNQVKTIADQHNAQAIIDENLLDEVTAMVEWPMALSGSFDQEFLKVPSEALISAMKKHQKYFHLLDKQGNLLALFITIANIDSSQPELIKQGNERVIRPRLADAGFFYNNDLQTSFSDQLESLKKVVFQNKLGSLYDKTQRVKNIAEYLAQQFNLDKTIAQRAVELSKTDLMSEMVGEFPDLQGIMGRYYAQNNGEDNNVCIALDEQYLPRFSGDKVSDNAYAQVLSLSDRIDSLFGIFAIGMQPTGDKDPFALRRASLGIIRTLVENKLDLDLLGLIQQAAENYPDDISSKAESGALLKFINDRFKGYLLDQNISADVFDSVAALGLSNPYEIYLRVQAVNHFKTLAEAKSLAAANKRISNILKKNKLESGVVVDSQLFIEESEKQLHQAMTTMNQQLEQLLTERNYTDYLVSLSNLHQNIDDFFDNVMVLCDDEKLKNNRISLVSTIHSLFIKVADLSLLQ